VNQLIQNTGIDRLAVSVRIYGRLEYMKNILYFPYISYLVDIVILSIYELIVIKSWGFDYHICIHFKPYK
jgi:hypothetical protein